MAEAPNVEDLRKLFKGMDATTDEQTDVWLKPVRDKLFTMFKSHLKAEYHREAFSWVAGLCMTMGDFSWIPSTEDKWTSAEAKMFSLIARLSMNEILILLPYLQRHLACNEEVEREDGKVMARPADESEYDAFGDHLAILESTIISLVKNQEEPADETRVAQNTLTDCMSASELQNLLQRLKETVSELCDYLGCCQRYWSHLLEPFHGDRLAAFKGSLRIMSLWLSEDSGSFEAQCERFLVDLIVRSLLLEDRTVDKDISMTALHSICTQNEVLLGVLKRHSSHEAALQKYLDYVQEERNVAEPVSKKVEKKSKLRCGLVRDLMSMMQQQQ